MVALLQIAFAASSLLHSPGALNPAVTQDTIAQTVCVPGWAQTIRPARRYTSLLKRAQMKARHLGGSPGQYEEDHVIPLDLGGHPTAPANLEPQLWPEARRKDYWEVRLKRDVCGGRMTLVEAQRRIRHWKDLRK